MSSVPSLEEFVRLSRDYDEVSVLVTKPEKMAYAKKHGIVIAENENFDILHRRMLDIRMRWKEMLDSLSENDTETQK